MGTTFKEAGKNSAAMQDASMSLDLLTIAFEALKPLFQAFQPIISIVNAMFTAFAGALTAELIPALQPLFTALIGMIPIFTELGTIVGGFIAAILVPLVGVLTTIIPIFATFLMNLLQSEEFLALVNLATTAFVLGITFLIDNVDLIILSVGALMLAFTFILPIINDLVIPAIMAFIMVIAIMVDAITLGAAGAVDYVTALMGSISGIVMPVGSYEPTEPFLTPGIQMQAGTDLITKTGYFYGHAGEAVTPATEVGLQTSLLEELILETRLTREETRFREAFRRY